MPELDDRIRSLVASAVASAPPAPDIDPTTVARRKRSASWLRGGAAALAALLAAGGGYAILSPASDDSSVDTVTPTTSVTPTPPAASPPVIVTAGPDGVTELVGGRSRVVTDEPMAFALALDNGDVIAQRDNDYGATRDDTVPLLVGTDGAMTPVLDARRLEGNVELHDFSVVEGRRLLLYSVLVSGDPEKTREQLFVRDLDSGDTVDLGTIGGWESGTSRLHLASTGLIVGTTYAEASHALFVAAVAGSPAAARPLPQATDFELQTSYGDGGCPCPTGFVLDAAGTNLYWLEEARDGSTDSVVVVAAPLDDPSNARRTALSPPRLANLALTQLILDIGDEGYLWSYPDTGDGPEHSPVLITENSPASAHTDLPGSVATVGPNG